MTRIGIYGGTFSPPHNGHLAAARAFMKQMWLDLLYIIPTALPPHKEMACPVSADHRLQMCRLAFAGMEGVYVSDMEIRRGGRSYTVDTLRELRAHYPDNVELFFITGADAVAHIVKWRESAAIADLARLIAVTRPGYALTDERRRAIEDEGSFDVSYLEVTALAVSSSDLRERVAAGKSIRYLVMQRVLDYVLEHGLYSGAGDASARKETL